MNTHLLPVWLWRLATAEVAECPCGIAEHAQLAAVTEKVEQWAECTLGKNIITACWAVSGNVTKGPDSLFPHVWLVAAEELNEDGHGTGLDDHLRLLGGAGCNIRERPGSFELDESVRRLEELDEAADDAGLDYLLDRWVALL